MFSMADDFVYQISVITENHSDAGTDEEVFIRLYGADEKSDGNWYLSLPRQNNFERGDLDTFFVETNFMGEIKKIFIFIEANKGDKEGVSSAWHLNYVKVSANYGGQNHEWVFPIKKWLGVKNRDINAPTVTYDNLIVYQDGTFTTYQSSDALNFALEGTTKKRVKGGAPLPT